MKEILIFTNCITNISMTIEGINKSDNTIILSAISNYVEMTASKPFDEILIQLVISAISLILATYVGYKISQKQEKREFKRNCHIEYLYVLNDYANSFNDISTNLLAIIKLQEVFFGTNPNQYSYEINDDYLDIKLKMSQMIKYINLDSIKKNILKEDYESAINKSNQILCNVDLFKDIVNELQREAGKYLYFIDKKHKDEFYDIMDTIMEATNDNNNMKGFHIETYKQSINECMKKLKDTIEK